MSNKRYSAAFVLPAENKKHLGDYGWEFSSTEFVEEHTLNTIFDSYSQFAEGTFDQDTYRSGELIIDAIRENGKIEHIYVRDYSIDKKNIETLSCALKHDFKVEFFVPNG